MSQSQLCSYLLDWSICIDCSVSKRCTISRRFSDPSFNKLVSPSFKFVRNADSDAPLAFVVGIVVVANVVAQVATKTKNNLAILLFLQCSVAYIQSSSEKRSCYREFLAHLTSRGVFCETHTVPNLYFCSNKSC